MIPKKPNIEEFVVKFSALENAAKAYPIPREAFDDAEAFLAWADGARLSSSQEQSALLIATVINDYRPLPGNRVFDFAKAVSGWDSEQKSIFVQWVQDSFG